jgi:hypothetical protein
VLISFTNYNAAAGIPRINQLAQMSKQMEQKAVIEQAAAAGWQHQQSQKQWWRFWNTYYDNEDDYIDNDDWNDLVQELQDLVRQQMSDVTSALKLLPESLEFHPTPQQLWKAIQWDGPYQIPQMLLVQFDNNIIHQSSQLATKILLSNKTLDVNLPDCGEHI